VALVKNNVVVVVVVAAAAAAGRRIGGGQLCMKMKENFWVHYVLSSPLFSSGYL